MKLKRKITGMVALAMILTLCACSKREMPNNETETEIPTVEVINEMDQVEDGGYYVCRNGSYEKLYVGRANYEVSAQSGVNENRTLWFMDDFDRVPTMYKGDQLVFKTAGILSETVVIERFEYCGYTIGISGLRRLDSGRYSLSLDAADKTINPDSDAMQLTKLGASLVIIDRFGGADLRSGNVSNGGCILGLTKDKVYAADVYVGTFYHEMQLTADTQALTSMEAARTVDYEFLQNQLISIKIPEYYNSGYYLINGYGLVRYVNGTSYNEDTDFNIPNVPPEEERSSEEEKKGQKENRRYYDEKTEITVDRDSEYLVTLNCFPEEESGRPGAILYNGDKAHQFKRTDKDNVLQLTAELKAGEYLISTSGIGDGYYEIEIEDLAPEETEEESESE